MVTLDGRAMERLGGWPDPLLNANYMFFFSTDLVEMRSNPTTRYESIYGRPYQGIPAYVMYTSGIRTDKHKVQGKYRRITSSCPVAEYSPQVNGSTTTAINNKYQSYTIMIAGVLGVIGPQSASSSWRLPLTSQGRAVGVESKVDDVTGTDQVTMP